MNKPISNHNVVIVIIDYRDRIWAELNNDRNWKFRTEKAENAAQSANCLTSVKFYPHPLSRKLPLLCKRAIGRVEVDKSLNASPVN